MEDIPDMYHKTGLYHQQRMNHTKVFEPFSRLLYNNIRTVLYLNAGDCSLFMDAIYPMMPPNIEQFVITDPSPQLINRASTTYKHFAPKIIFRELDILDPELQPEEEFDCIISISNIRWMHNMGVSLSNFSGLMKPHGTGIILVETYNMYHTVAIKPLALQERWAAYISDIVRGFSPYDSCDKAIEELPSILYQHRFREFNVKAEPVLYEAPNFPALRDILHYSYRVGSLVPAEQIAEFYKQVKQLMERSGCVTITPTQTVRYRMTAEISSFTFIKESAYLN